MNEPDDGWMPRLADGVPIWKLAQDLNQPELMDGSLIVPETEGSPSAPRVVRWHVRNLVPLDTARTAHPLELERATVAFRAATQRIERALESEASPYHGFRKAFTLPSLSGEHYFFDVIKCKLHVIHWGAEPRSHGARGETVYGFGNLAEAFAPRVETKPMASAERREALEAPSKREPTEARRTPWWALAAAAVALVAALYVIGTQYGAAAALAPDAAAIVATTVATAPILTAARPHVGRESLLPFDKPLLFEFGSARIDAQGDTTIRRTAAYLAAHSEIVRVRIEGHADASGEDDKNFVLSTARALAVERALIAAGVDRERLTIDAHGQTKPTVPDASVPAQAAQNRRVELWILRNDAAVENNP